MKKYVRTTLGLFISILAIIIIINTVDSRLVIQSLQNIRYIPIVIAFSLNSLLFLFAALRLSTLYSVLGKKAKLFHFYRAVVIGFLGNIILPFRAGELVKTGLISRHGKSARSTAFSVVFIERLFDILLVFIILLFSIIFFNANNFNFTMITGIAIFLIFTITILVYLNNNSKALQKLFKKITSKKFGKNIGFHLYKGLKTLDSSRITILTSILTILFWTTQLFIFLFTLLSFSISLEIYELLFLLSVTAFTSAIPSGPAQLGTLEGAIVIGMSVIGVSIRESLPFAVLYHVLHIVFVLVFGSFMIIYEIHKYGTFIDIFRKPGVSL